MKGLTENSSFTAHRSLLLVLCLSVFCLLFSGCGGGRKGEEQGAVTPTTATISGQFKDETTSDWSGITVSLETTTAGKTRIVEETINNVIQGKLKAEDLNSIQRQRKVEKTTQTDKEGKFTFTDVQPGEYTIVTHKGDKGANITDVKVKAGEQKKLPPWAIKTKGKIQGCAKFEDKQDHSNIMVYIAGVSGIAMTITDGSFTIPEIYPGVYILIAKDITGQYSDGLALGVEVTAGGTTTLASCITLKKKPAANQIPVIKDITVSPEIIYSTKTATVIVTATDADNDPLTYAYSVSGGTITGAGSSVTYTAPDVDEFSAYNIKVIVSDNKASVYGRTYVFVKPVEITKLVIDKITLPPQQIQTGQTATITVTVSGGVPPYTYTYSPTTGTIQGSGSSVTYKAPATIPGNYAIYTVNITVKDSIGQEEDGMVNILVTKGTEPPPVADVHRVSFTGKTLIAYDVNNNKLWDFTAGADITKALVSDIQGDTKNEVVFGTGIDFAHNKPTSDTGYLYALDK